MKNIDTLPDDIYKFMAGDGEFPDFTKEDVARLTAGLTDMLYNRLKERRLAGTKPREFTLRMSNYGTAPRKLWYEANVGREKIAKPNPVMYLNFLIGDVWEEVILLLAQLSGHTVERRQETVSVDDLPGHIDAVIDGVMADVKSASKWSFEKKFAGGDIFNGGDSFNYLPQIRGYGVATGIPEQAFVVANKEDGRICVVRVPDTVEVDVRGKIANARSVVTLPAPPTEKCYPDEFDGASGNKVISKDCSFCVFKHMCWQDANGGKGLRTFAYSNGPKYFTHVEKEPKVEEVINSGGFIYKED